MLNQKLKKKKRKYYPMCGHLILCFGKLTSVVDDSEKYDSK